MASPFSKNSQAYALLQSGAPASDIGAVLKTQGFGLEVLDWEVYDDVSVASNTAVTSVKMFQTPIGQAGKSEADTSLTQAGQLEGGQAFRVRGYALTVLPTVSIADAVAFSQNTWFNFVISSGRSYLSRPAIFIPGASAPIVNAAATTVAATSIESVTNGLPSIGNILPVMYPVTIGDGENFYVQMTVSTAFSTSAAGTGLKFWFRMFGELFRFIR